MNKLEKSGYGIPRDKPINYMREILTAITAFGAILACSFFIVMISIPPTATI